MPIRIFNSWRASGVVPPEWRPAEPPGHLVKVPVKNPDVLDALQQLLPGRWMKVYRMGMNRTEVHYFEHISGKVANVKMKFKG